MRGRLAACCLLAAGCVTLPRISPGAVPRARPGENHALRLNWGGHADTPIALTALGVRDFTLSARVALEHVRGFYAWVFGESGRGTFIVGKDTASGALLVDLGFGRRVTADVLPASTWIHLTVVGSSDTARVFIEGRPVAAVPIERGIWSGRGNLRLGTRGDDVPGEQLFGYLDDVWVIGRALTAEEVATLAADDEAPAGAPVAVRYTFEPGSELPELIGDAQIVRVADDAPPPPIDSNMTTTLRLPFDGEWSVLQGEESGGSHGGYAAYAFDFVPAGAAEPPPERAADPAAWPCFGRPVFSPADGVVVAAHDGRPDAPFNKQNDPGNGVVIEHAPGELSEFVHLRKGSVKVAVGEHVVRGQVIGECGSSGNAAAPHLHWALSGFRAPIITRPARFEYQVHTGDGWMEALGAPGAGDVIRPEAPR